MTHAEFIDWANQQDAAGVKDAMGYPLTSWLLSVREPDGTVARDRLQRPIYETQAVYKARACVVPVGQTKDLFA